MSHIPIKSEYDDDYDTDEFTETSPAKADKSKNDKTKNDGENSSLPAGNITMEKEQVRVKSEPKDAEEATTESITEQSSTQLSLQSEQTVVTEGHTVVAEGQTVVPVEQQVVADEQRVPNDKEETLALPAETQIVVKSEPKDMETAPNQPNETTTDAAPTLQEAVVTPSLNDATSAKPTNENEDPENLPDNFFDDLLDNAESIKAVLATQEVSTEATAAATVQVKSERRGEDEDNTEAGEIVEEEIPSANFFEDILRDRMAERLEEGELEMKYSDKLLMLKELEQKEKEKNHKSHKKDKKSKKKSHKRSLERRDSHESRSPRSNSNERSSKRGRREKSSSPTVERTAQSLFPFAPVVVEPQSTVTPTALVDGDMEELPTTSGASTNTADREPQRRIAVKSEFNTFAEGAEEDLIQCLPVQNADNLFTRRDNTNIMATTQPVNPFAGFKRIKLEKPTEEHAVFRDDVMEIRTPKQKRESAMMRAAAVIAEFRNAESAKPFSNFLYTATIRKLPTSSSYVQQQIYENRSPLHTVNNVSYKFNSHATRFSLHEWGLETIPSNAIKAAKILGYDADNLSFKRKLIKFPMRLQKVKTEVQDFGEQVEETTSSIFTNAMTQTDEVTVIAGRRNIAPSVGVQAMPKCSSIFTQTTESGGSSLQSHSSQSHDDLPLMKLISEFNENQLMAVHDFAELIMEHSSGSNNAMDMYRLRQRILDIFKSSQLPSSVAPPVAPQHHHLPHNSAAYAHRVGQQQQRHQQRVDPRYHSYQQVPAAPYQRAPPQARTAARSPAMPTAQSQIPPSPAPKYYGRGGLRR